jgi:hypothetical protein
MLKISHLIVSSILLFGINLSAKDYPLERTINITLSNHSTTVLEFPFKIIDLQFDPFKRITFISKNELKQNDEVESSDIKVPKITEKRVINGQEVTVVKKNPLAETPKKNTKPLHVKKSKDGNIIEIRPSQTGSTKAIVWGFKDYPVMLNIKVEKHTSDTNDYYKFIDYSTPEKELIAFEGQRHETVIKKLMLSGYLNETPKGYTKEILNSFEESDNYLLQLDSILVGKNYNLRAYTFLNTSNEDFKIEEKMFYQKGNVYAVSVEKLGRILKPNEKTRVFVVVKDI